MDVILIHGMWCTGAHWSRVETFLSSHGFNVHAPTLPYHSKDAAQKVATASLKEYRKFLNDYIDDLDLDVPPIIIGHSMGGLLAQQIAGDRPLSALVLLTPAPPWGVNGLHPDNTRALFPALARWGFWKKPHQLSEQAFRDYATNCLSEEEQNNWYPMSVAESGRVLFEIGFWMADPSRASQANADISAPVFIVGCAHDKLVPISVVRRVARRYPNRVLREYDDRDHWVIGDSQTDDMMKEILTWLTNNHVVVQS